MSSEISGWFLSDLHLKDINERSGNTLLRFLSDLDQGVHPCTHLFLMGDIFDLWIGDHDFFYEKFKPIIDLISALKEKGVNVQYFEGNHDVHVKKFWEERYGIPCHAGSEYFDLQGILVRVEHGDLINLQDKAYLRLRAFLRLELLEKLAYKVPGYLWNQIGVRASQLSRRFSGQARQDKVEELRVMIRDHAHRSFAERGFDFIVTGHMHVRDEYQFQVGDREVRSFNLGSWFDRARVLNITSREQTQDFKWVDLN